MTPFEKILLVLYIMLMIVVFYLFHLNDTKNSFTFRDDSEVNFNYHSDGVNYAAVMSGKDYADKMMK